MVKSTEEILGKEEVENQVRKIKEETIVVGDYQINTLIGVLLTLIDATFTDKEQRRAMKTCIKSRVWDWFYKECHTGSQFSVMNEIAKYSGVDSPQE